MCRRRNSAASASRSVTARHQLTAGLKNITNFTLTGSKRVLLLLAMLPALVVGCSKDEETNDNPLKDTKWVSEQVWSGGIRGTETLTFGDKNVTIEAVSNDGSISNKVNGTYTYNPPTIVILVSSNGQSVTISMTVDGNKISYETNGTTYIYNKQ